jgi:hypothetical protein
MNWFGILIGLSTLLIIGLGFFWVIRGERYFGYLWWPYTMGMGMALVAVSVCITSNWISALIGAAGASLIWGSTELKEQAVRSELGWVPFHKEKISPPFAKFIKRIRAPHL